VPKIKTVKAKAPTRKKASPKKATAKKASTRKKSPTVRAGQAALPGVETSNQSVFGGRLSPDSLRPWRSNPKRARPLTTKQPLHLMLRSELAKGKLSFIKHDKDLKRILSRLGKRFGIVLLDYANSGERLHMVVKLSKRETFTPFMRSATGLIAREILNVQRGRAWLERPAPDVEVAGPQKRRFWEGRPFSRVINSGDDFKGVKRYFAMLRLEAKDLLPAAKRNMIKRLKALEMTGQPFVALEAAE